MNASLRIAALALLGLAGCGTLEEGAQSVGLTNPFAREATSANRYGPAPAPPPPPVDDWTAANFQAWSPNTPDYLLYPGDQIDISVPSAPELSRQVIIGPDGRFNFPYAGAVMAANRSTPDVEASLSSALSRDLRRPYVEISPIGFGSQKILVLGEVGQPGMYDLPGPMGALEAIALAGGFADSADRGDVSIIRRAANGRPMRREVDLAATLRGVEGGDYDVLVRYDIVFVPRSGLAGAGIFMQQVRDLIPFNIGFSYALGDDYERVQTNASIP